MKSWRQLRSFVILSLENMRFLILSMGVLLLNLAVTTVTEQLDPIDNMCFRFDHQCKEIFYLIAQPILDIS